ncbi:AraC family transcriptional regulator [Streptomyces sp. NPDC097619]|uniref:AraC family transcriptional regulator n=1 Tax=Streptomyces sp. NPDC097619 TaxID=3157228 RepID=UPI00331B4254
MSLDEIRTLLDRHARSARRNGPDGTTPVDGVLVSRVDRSDPPAPATSGTVLALIAQGSKRLVLGDRVLAYGPGEYLVASVDLPVTGQFVGATPEHPALGFGLTLDPSDVAALLLRSGTGPTPRATGGPPPGIAVSRAPDALLDAVVRLLRLLDEPRDRDVLAPLVKQEILWRLLTGEQGRAVRQLGLADSSLSHVSRAVQWIREHYAEPFRVEELARRTGMSPSAFYRNFHAVTAMSPLRFQKQIRLRQARLLLATHPRDVTGVGHRVGYDSPSQFSREYRRQFGLPPSEDAARLYGAVRAAEDAGES